MVLLWATISIGAQDKAVDVPLNNPFTLNHPAISEVKISGAVVAVINNGDFVHPTFSPDGKRLAYSNVLVKGGFENTEVLLYDLGANKRSVLLNSRRAKTYATYKAAVTGMEWRSPRRLEVSISDGDVGLSELIFNPVNRRLLQTKYTDFDEAVFPSPLSPDAQKTYQQAVRLFPSFPANVLEDELGDTAVVLPDRGIVLQKNYAGHDNDVWFLDFQNKSVTSLINLPDDARRGFDGAVSFNSSIIIVLSHGLKTSLFLYRDGKISGVGEFSSKGFGRIEVKHVSPSRVIFLIKTHATYERGDNPLFVFDGTQLMRIKDYPELYDADVDPAGQRIAYCHWVGDRRHIVVREQNTNITDRKDGPGH